jgi:hypothetical protein
MLKLIFKWSQLWLLTAPRKNISWSDFKMQLLDAEESKKVEKHNWIYKVLSPSHYYLIKSNWENMKARIIVSRHWDMKA